jgi:quercetin dioxygenase-like cupin family protein
MSDGGTPAERRAKGIAFYRATDAPLLDDSTMSPPRVDKAVYTTLDLKPLAAGSRVTVLFKGEGPGGFSLVHAWFGAGHRLPRHSHSADCLYYVLSGQAVMGSRVLEPGDGFFVKADQPYAYEAGPDGVEVLEFRSATSFDMQVFDQTVERWQPIVAAAVANHERWLATRPG